MGKWKYLAADASFYPYAIEDNRPNKEELYDLEADIGEKNNVAGQHPDIVARLKEEYMKLNSRAPSRAQKGAGKKHDEEVSEKGDK